MRIIVKNTTACNLRCVYCSEGERAPSYLDESLFKKMVDELPELLDSLNDKNINILWHGGEPTLWGENRLTSAMSYAEEHLSDYNLDFSMQSNGYHIGDRLMEVIRRHRVRVGISLDGYQEIHDQNRPAADGSHTFDAILKNIDRLREDDLFGGILIVINTATPLDTDRLFDLIRRTGGSARINPLLSCGRASGTDTSDISENYLNLLEALCEKIMNSEENVLIDPIDGLLDAILTDGTVGECSFSGFCAKHIISLYADGLVGFCGRDSATLSYAYGNLRNQSLASLYFSDTAELMRQRDSYLKEHDCKDCKIWNFCHGGCSYASLTAFGELNRKSIECENRKKLVNYMQTTGLKLLKERIIRKKRESREKLRKKMEMLKILESFNERQ